MDIPDEELQIEEWQQTAAKQKAPQWTGDLSDDCTEEWAGLCLRAEWMNEIDWWWSVYDKRTQIEIDSSNRHEERYESGDAARVAADKAARVFLGVR